MSDDKVRFGDLKINDRFDVDGDLFINYNYPKLCKCIKVEDEVGQEIDGCRFLLGKDDMVWKPDTVT